MIGNIKARESLVPMAPAPVTVHAAPGSKDFYAAIEKGAREYGWNVLESVIRDTRADTDIPRNVRNHIVRKLEFMLKRMETEEAKRVTPCPELALRKSMIKKIMKAEKAKWPHDGVDIADAEYNGLVPGSEAANTFVNLLRQLEDAGN